MIPQEKEARATVDYMTGEGQKNLLSVGSGW